MGQQTNLPVSKDKDPARFVRRRPRDPWNFPTIIHAAPHVWEQQYLQ
jgi:hypothetical protein